jgi:hypothetical protein
MLTKLLRGALRGLTAAGASRLVRPSSLRLDPAVGRKETGVIGGTVSCSTVGGKTSVSPAPALSKTTCL